MTPMADRHTYLVLAQPSWDGHALDLSVPELGETHTTALDLLEGEVLIRQAIALAIDTNDTASFEVDIRESEPGL